MFAGLDLLLGCITNVSFKGKMIRQFLKQKEKNTDLRL